MSSNEPKRQKLKSLEEKKEMRKKVPKKFQFEKEATNFKKGIPYILA
jgi:hypothetical protein